MPGSISLPISPHPPHPLQPHPIAKLGTNVSQVFCSSAIETLLIASVLLNAPPLPKYKWAVSLPCNQHLHTRIYRANHIICNRSYRKRSFDPLQHTSLIIHPSLPLKHCHTGWAIIPIQTCKSIPCATSTHSYTGWTTMVTETCIYMAPFLTVHTYINVCTGWTR